MNGQKGFLITIIILVVVGVGLQVYSMSKNRKKKVVALDAPDEMKNYHIDAGDLTQEIIED